MSAQPAVMPVVLAIDTSTPLLCAAVGSVGGSHERNIEAGRHTGALVPQVVNAVLADARLDAADLTAVAVGVGPGPYTSLRAGVMFAEAAAAALQIPVMGACSLDVTARAHVLSGAAGEDFVVAADARRRELYWARYRCNGHRLTGPRVDPRAQLQAEWTERDLAVVTASPSAAALAEWVIVEYQRHLGAMPPLAASPSHWAAPSQDAADVDIPQALLSARPLYLRRPDAQPATVNPSPLEQSL